MKEYDYRTKDQGPRLRLQYLITIFIVVTFDVDVDRYADELFQTASSQCTNKQTPTQSM